MALSTGQLNRATLDRQLLLRRAPWTVTETVRHLVGLQAQEPASPYLALWNRIEGLRPADLDAALAAATLVKASLMRVTLHLVDHADWAPFHAAMLPVLRGARLHDRRFTATGCSVADLDRALPELLAFTARPRTSQELAVFVEARFGPDATKGVWWALRTYAPLRREATGGPWSFDHRAVYRSDPAPDTPAAPSAALRLLAKRYLASFGPATPRDFAQFCLVGQQSARDALTPDDEVEAVEGEDGLTLYDVRGAPRPSADTTAPPRLLGMWDSILLAHHDRSRIIPDAYRGTVLRRNGDALPTLLVEGHVAGIWRTTEHGIEATAFHRLSDAAWEGLDREARGLRDLLAGRDPHPYRRHHHWWTRPMPRAEVRILAG